MVRVGLERDLSDVTMSLTDLDAGSGDDVVVSSSKKPAGGRPKRRSFTAEYKLQILEPATS